jgi:hypothetical protein
MLAGTFEARMMDNPDGSGFQSEIAPLVAGISKSMPRIKFFVKIYSHR